MKSHSNERPEKVVKLGVNVYAYNYNIHEEDGMYNYETELFKNYPTRDEVINRIVTNKYPDGAESAILRKGIKDPLNAEYLEYYDFVESIKFATKEDFRNI